jgi:AraC-like DNA-binding protein
VELTRLQFWDLLLRGAAGGLLLFHVIHMLRPGPHRLARFTFAAFTLTVLAYLFCSLPAEFAVAMPARLALLALCVSTAPLLWLAMQALFDDEFRLGAVNTSVIVAALVFNLVCLAEPVRAALEPMQYRALRFVQQVVLLGFGIAALWVALKEWRADLVEARRVARNWIALVIGIYVVLTLIVELAIEGRPIGRLLPTLQVAGIGLVALGIAVLLANRRLDAVLAPEPAPAAEPEALESAAAPPQRIDARLQERLLRAMTADRIYRSEDLTLPSLATKLGAGEAALRKLINEGLGYRNFNDFLHRYRLEEAAARLAAEDLPILSIALEAGYGSIGPFNRAFKQRLGVTPTEYRAAARIKATKNTN